MSELFWGSLELVVRCVETIRDDFKGWKDVKNPRNAKEYA
jgi:hypothetical protein